MAWKGLPVVAGNTSVAWNRFVARGGTATTAFTVVQPSSAGSRSQEIHGFFLSSGTTCSFTVTGCTIECDGTVSGSGSALSVTVTSGKVYEFSLEALSTTAVKLLVYEW